MVYVISLVANTCGYDGGRIGPTHCAVIAGVPGDKCRQCWACRIPLAGACLTHSGPEVESMPASTAAPGGFHGSRTRPRSGSTPCDDASPPRSAPGIRPYPLPPCLVGSWLQCTCRL